MFSVFKRSNKIPQESVNKEKYSFLRLSHYKNTNIDLNFENDQEYVDHYINHGVFEGRSPNALIWSDELGEIKLESLTETLNIFDFQGSAWKYYRTNFNVVGDEVESEFNYLLDILEKWNIYEKEAVVIFLSIYRPLGSLDKAYSGCLPAYFNFLECIEFDDIKRYHLWYEEYVKTGTPFTSLFDKAFYVESYPDISGLNNVFEHYLLYGDEEGRLPSPFFESYYYSRSGDDMGFKGLFSFNKNPSPVYLDAVSQFCERYYFRTDREFILEKLLKLTKILNGYFDKSGQFSLFIKMINIDYMVCLSPSLGKDPVEVIENWVRGGCSEEFSPYFLEKNSSGSSNYLKRYVSWYKNDLPKRISPSCMFDEGFYKEKHLDLQGYPDWLFIHFIRHGQFENRQAHRLFDTGWIGYHYDTQGYSAIDYYYKCEHLKTSIKPAPAIMAINKGIDDIDSRYLLAGITSVIKGCNDGKIFDFSEGSELSRVINEASKIDPLIQPNIPERMFTLMPFSSDVYAEIRRFAKLVGKKHTLIFRDGINFGGADVVLKHTYKSAKLQNDSVAIVSTGEVDWSVVEAHGINPNDVIDLSYVVGFSELSLSAHYVYDLIIGSGCQQIYNVNCGAMWQATEDFGKTITLKSKINAFMFCDDRDEFGNVAGYPAKYFISSARYVDSLFVDSHALKETLISRSCGSQVLERKIKVLATPLEDDMASTYEYASSLTIEKPTVAWAGRFDEQKCPDLLKKIAQQLPDVTFMVWGKAVLSKKNYDLESVDNIKLMGLYDDVSDITREKCALYLYTSAWDGVPTVLLRMQEQGLPIIASNVGGVGEAMPCIGLIDGFNPDDYVNKISYYLDNLIDVAQDFDVFKEKNLSGRTFTNFHEVVSGACNEK